ncbi:MAG: cytochrome c biogenesis protein CcdA [Anaerolineae bacterium]
MSPTGHRPPSRIGLAVVLLFVLVALPIQITAQSDEEPIARLIIFHSPTCPHCVYVLENVLPALQARYGSHLEVRLYDLTEPNNYASYAALHERYPDLPTGIPQAYISGQVIVGDTPIEEQVPLLIDSCITQGGCQWTLEFNNAVAATPVPVAQQPIYLAYCYDPTCLECEQVTYALGYLESQNANLVVRRFNVRDDAALIEAMCERYGVPEHDRLRAPAIFIADQYLVEEEISLTQLSDMIANPESAATGAPWENLNTADVSSATARITDRFGGFNILAVAAAGLLDGINPCAFTTIIFFISYLALTGRSQREVLLVGVAFTVAVFLTYLLMGLGLSTLVEQISMVSTVGRVIYGVTALICLGLAVVSMTDYIKIRRGQLTEIALQLPKSLKKRIHSTIRSHSRMRNTVLAAFSAGVLVSVFELVCTGQVYLPTIVFMTGVAEQRLTAVTYLVFYNLMFVVPLLAVFTVTYFGIGSQRLTAIFQQNAGAVKLLTAALFALFGIWLVILVLGVGQ